MQRTGFGIVLGAALGAAALMHPAAASPYDAEYVFGDSLSDNGNLAEVYALPGHTPTNFPNPPSYHDSFTNGPVAVANLASSIGLPLNPSLWVSGFKDVNGLFGGANFIPGTNYAVAGATSAYQALGGPANINLPQQVQAYGLYSSGKADANALYVVMIGGNDVRNATIQGTGAAGVAAGVQAELAAIGQLSTEGADHFLIVNVPNVEVIPEFAQDAPAEAATATQLSQLYDSQLSAGIAGLGLPGGTVTQFDLYSYANNIAANGAALGFENTTDRCFTSTPFSPAATPQCGPNGANVNNFLYWDSIHPSAREQAFWAQGFQSALGLPVTGFAALPEPSSLPLLTTFLMLFAAGVIGRTYARTRSAPAS